MSFFKKFFTRDKEDDLNRGLEKTKSNIFTQITKAIAGKSKVDIEFLDELEQILIQSDVGLETTIKIIDRLEVKVADQKYFNTAELNSILKQVIADLLSENKTEDQTSQVMEEAERDALRTAAFEETTDDTVFEDPDSNKRLRLRPFSTKTMDYCEQYGLTMMMGQADELTRDEMIKQVAIFGWMQSAPIPEVIKANREGTWRDAVEVFEFGLTPQLMIQLVKETRRISKLAEAGAFELQEKESASDNADGEADPGNY